MTKKIKDSHTSMWFDKIAKSMDTRIDMLLACYTKNAHLLEQKYSRLVGYT